MTRVLVFEGNARGPEGSLPEKWQPPKRYDGPAPTKLKIIVDPFMFFDGGY